MLRKGHESDISDRQAVKSLTPEWDAVELSLLELCNGDLAAPSLVIECKARTM